ncbi:C45 family autoproteolytic acyltransferase/hydrolase [Methanospirillum stamsii]|uniref:C45 family autoproteolytic acyltransferase/hydolase n=1 Tax=Methanospirillum stamsii TaxID=1277351 RepID=UPI0015E82DF3|nr:C45 family peptidase [Methanospirillum stamsii]
MKTLLLVMLLCMLTIPVSVLSAEQEQSPAGTSVADLPLIATFEGGERYQAGIYPVIVLSGSYREMGCQYGGLMKPELNEEYSFLMDSLTNQGITREEIIEEAGQVPQFYPQRIKEIFAGMAETTGLTTDDIAFLYYGPIFLLFATPNQEAVPASCSYLAAWGDYTKGGSPILSRNWDLGDSILPLTEWYVLAIYRPNDGSNIIATWSPAGVRPETFMNNKGLFIADDNCGREDDAPETRPEFITEYYRFMFDYSDLNALEAAINGTIPDTGWIVDVAGPDEAFVYEKSTNRTVKRTGDGVIAAANHFVDPSWNLPEPPEHSLSRYSNLLRQAEEAKGMIDAEKMMEIRDVCIEDGGSKFCHSDLGGGKYSSNHQVVFEPATLTLWMNVMDKDWQKVELPSLFSNETLK